MIILPLLNRECQSCHHCRIHCGTKDFALPENRRAHALLERQGIRHTYRERPGGHDMRFARVVAGEQVAFLITAFSKENRR